MSAQYHVNPETGKTGVCGSNPNNPNARGCDFAQNGIDAPHFVNEKEAQQHSESIMKEKHGNVSTMKKSKESNLKNNLAKLRKQFEQAKANDDIDAQANISLDIQYLMIANKLGTTIVNKEPATKDNLEELINDYELDYGNEEVYEQGDEIHFTIEAPNNATMGLRVPKNATIREVRETMIEYMNDFDAEHEFNDLWSEQFGAHNGFTSRGFREMLDSDEAFYRDRANTIQKDLDKL